MNCTYTTHNLEKEELAKHTINHKKGLPMFFRQFKNATKLVN